MLVQGLILGSLCFPWFVRRFFSAPLIARQGLCRQLGAPGNWSTAGLRSEWPPNRSASRSFRSFPPGEQCWQSSKTMCWGGVVDRQIESGGRSNARSPSEPRNLANTSATGSAPPIPGCTRHRHSICARRASGSCLSKAQRQLRRIAWLAAWITSALPTIQEPASGFGVGSAAEQNGFTFCQRARTMYHRATSLRPRMTGRQSFCRRVQSHCTGGVPCPH